MSYSQNSEEEIICNLFKDSPPGRFLDIGAYDGRTFSNTLRLAELGWGGICIEPSPGPFRALLELHGNSPNIKLINCAIDTSTTLTKFYDSSGDAVSTLDQKHKERWQGAKVNFREYWLQTLALQDFFERFGHNFEFVNIDVEGCNLKLFCALPFNRLVTTKVICVEHESQQEHMLDVAEPWGYRQVAMNAENLILAR